MTQTLFQSDPMVIAALHLPDFNLNRHRSMAWYEDYALANASVFARAGIPWIKLQDQTRTAASAAPETLTIMASLARLIRAELPDLGLGIIVEAHDPRAALAVAHASGAGFVRLKVFVGGAMTSEGPRDGMGAAAVAWRAGQRREDIAILADIHDRTARPLSDETQVTAAQWAAKVGADGLIITGTSFANTLSRIEDIRSSGQRRPILIGGGVTAENVPKALSCSEGVIVSSALMRTEADGDDLVKWDIDKTQRFMEAARGR